MRNMAQPVVMSHTLVTSDGVPIDAVHLPGESDLAIVLAHGFTFSWQRHSVWRIANRFNRVAGVISFDFRGHGRSGGLSTLGDREIKDLDVAVAYARQLGYKRIGLVGFSMGASIVVRYAGLIGGVDAAASISGPGRWYYRGTERMRRVHFAAEHRVGRLATRMLTRTRISPDRWDPTPVPPYEAAAQISPIPLLVVHGDKDLYFPVEHARQLYDAARDPKELWLIPGFAHAESGCGNGLADRIANWVVTAARTGTAQGEAGATRDVGEPGPSAGEAAPDAAEQAAEAAGAAAVADMSPADAIGAEALEAEESGTISAGMPSEGGPSARP